MRLTVPPTTLMKGVDHFGNDPRAMKSWSLRWLASARSIAVDESKLAIFGLRGALASCARDTAMIYPQARAIWVSLHGTVSRHSNPVRCALREAPIRCNSRTARERRYRCLRDMASGTGRLSADRFFRPGRMISSTARRRHENRNGIRSHVGGRRQLRAWCGGDVFPGSRQGQTATGDPPRQIAQRHHGDAQSRQRRCTRRCASRARCSGAGSAAVRPQRNTG